MSRDLIVFGEDWCGLPSSTQHLIKHLAVDRKIIWVNSIGLRRPKFIWYDLKRLWAKLIAKKSGKLSSSNSAKADVPNNNFFIINPLTLPAPKSRLARFIASTLLVLQIKPLVTKAGLESPLLWVSVPTAVDVAGKLGDSGLLYYCGDDFSALAGVDHSTVAKREAELVEKADLILAASAQLTSKFPSEKTHLLSHGVSYDLFSKPAPRAIDLPDDGRPIAGFYGSISEWFDIDLLHDTIEKLPLWHFIFIGKATIDVSRLKKFSNVQFLGERPHNQLPSYSQYWTASLLPFVQNKQIAACNPLKLYEYLAAGTAVISTDFPAIRPYRELVQVIMNSDSMVKALSNSIHLKDLPDFAISLRKTVANESWFYRAQQTSQWIESI